MKKNSTPPPSTKTKSAAAERLGGQPESDRDAREAGVQSATAPGTAKETRRKAR